MILVDGTPAVSIPADDRGLAYGDGLFETIAVVDGEILNWQRHVRRLSNDCARLCLPFPNIGQLYDETLVVSGGHRRSVVKIIITRGVGGNAYSPPAKVTMRRIVTRRDWPADYPAREESGIRVFVAKHRLSLNTGLAGIKHLNRLDQVLASQELINREAEEALMLGAAASVISATRSNLFIVRDETLYTPALHSCGVAGVMRAIVLELANGVGLAAEVSELTLDDLRGAEEIFLTNAIAGIWPVIALEDKPRHSYLIGSHTRALQAALREGNHHR